MRGCAAKLCCAPVMTSPCPIRGAGAKAIDRRSILTAAIVVCCCRAMAKALKRTRMAQSYCAAHPVTTGANFRRDVALHKRRSIGGSIGQLVPRRRLTEMKKVREASPSAAHRAGMHLRLSGPIGEITLGWDDMDSLEAEISRCIDSAKPLSHCQVRHFARAAFPLSSAARVLRIANDEPQRQRSWVRRFAASSQTWSRSSNASGRCCPRSRQFSSFLPPPGVTPRRQRSSPSGSPAPRRSACPITSRRKRNTTRAKASQWTPSW
jgi:hypothetical protein